ncbi:MAG TPA: cation transporter [Thermotogota bacterium]|nr:cation transporter [Thermotogota bacterium]
MTRQDEGHMILMLLRKNGPMRIEEIKAYFFKFASQFGFGFEQSHHQHQPSRRGKKDFFQELNTQIEILTYKGLIENKDGQLSLTKAGFYEGEQTDQHFQKAAGWVNKNLLSAEGATRNTVIVDAVLAFFKLLTGLMTSSVGLIADGTDAALDTLTAGVVFWSVKRKKELIGSFVIIAMMLVTAVGLGFDSVSSILDVFRGKSDRMVRPFLVIGVEGVSLLFAYFLMLYQRFVGKKSRSLALISQSVDSKNHIFVAGAVIAGAFLSLFNVHFVDAAIGAYIAIKIFIDSIGLLKETFSSMQGEAIDFDKFSGHMDKKWKSEKSKAFMATIVYSLLKRDAMNEKELIGTLKEAFQPGYIPVLSEFQIGFAVNTDFEGSFQSIIDPLLNHKILLKDGNAYYLNDEKRIEIEEYVSNTFILETKPAELEKRLKNLYHSDFDAIDGIGKAGQYLEEGENITAITRGKHNGAICLLMTTDKKIHLFSKRSNQHASIPFEAVDSFEETSGNHSTIRLVIHTAAQSFNFDYLSPRKSFGFVNEIKRHIDPEKVEYSDTDDEFTEKIKALHRIQKYIGKIQGV